jgi:hypothetical protein
MFNCAISGSGPKAEMAASPEHDRCSPTNGQSRSASAGPDWQPLKEKRGRRWSYLDRSHSTMPRVKAPGWLAVAGLAVAAGAGMLSIKSLSPSMRKMRV